MLWPGAAMRVNCWMRAYRGKICLPTEITWTKIPESRHWQLCLCAICHDTEWKGMICNSTSHRHEECSRTYPNEALVPHWAMESVI